MIKHAPGRSSGSEKWPTRTSIPAAALSASIVSTPITHTERNDAAIHTVVS